jgi:hypothetical protein
MQCRRLEGRCGVPRFKVADEVTRQWSNLSLLTSSATIRRVADEVTRQWLNLSLLTSSAMIGRVADEVTRQWFNPASSRRLLRSGG